MAVVGVDEPTEYVPLRHLQPLRDGWDTHESGGQTTHVLLHVTKQLLELVENWNKNKGVIVRVSE